MADEEMPKAPAKNQQPLVTFLIFIIVIGLLALAFFFGLKFRTTSPEEAIPTPTPEITLTPTVQPTPTPEEIAPTPTEEATESPSPTVTPTETPTPTLTPTPIPTIKFELWKNLYKVIFPTPTP